MVLMRAGAMGILAAFIGIAAGGFAVPTAVSGEPPAAMSLLMAAAGLPSLILGAVLFHLRPRNSIGLLLGFAGLVAVGMGGMDNYSALAWQLQLDGTAALPVSGVAVALGQGTWMLFYAPWAWLLLVFPSGRLMERKDKALAAAVSASVLLFCILAALGPVDSPLPQVARTEPLLPGAEVAAVLVLPLFLAALLACVFRFRARYRLAPGTDKLQMRWLAAAAILVPATLLLCWGSYLLLGTSDLVVAGLLLIYLLVPAAVTIALLQAQLFDVDRVVAAGLVVTGLGAVGLTVLAGVAGMAGAAVGQQSAALSAATTALLLLCLVPLHKRLVRWVDRKLYPRRWRVLEALATLDGQVQAGTARPEALEERLRGALDRPGLQLGYLLPGSEGLVTASQEPLAGSPSAVAVMAAGHPVGVLDLGMGEDRELPLGPDILAALARPMLLVGLRLELAQALGEVEASRARIVAAGHAERRRLERDLHDGAQQRLVALGMALRLAQRHLPPEQRQLTGVMDGAVAELGAVVAEIRQLAHGVRPSSLDAGLPAALEQLCHGAPFPIELALRHERDVPIPDLVGTTAYFVASEAVANATKYAQASRIAVRLEHDGRTVRLGVSDNGGGGAVLRKGGGG